MSTSADINSIIKVKKIKTELPTLAEQTGIPSTKGVGLSDAGDSSGSGMESPLTLEILTYDDTLDVDIEANNGTFTVKTAETAQVIDANGTIWAIDTIIYP